MRSRLSPAALIGVALLLFAAPHPAAAAEREWHGAHGGPATFQLVVARSAAAWRDLWKLAGRDPPAGFDEKADMAVGIFLGLRNTGGYDVDIRSVVAEKSYVEVTYAEHKPDPGAIVTQVLTTPYVIRVLPWADLPVVFRSAAHGAGLNQIPDQELRRLVARTDTLEADKDQLTATVEAAEQRLREFEEILERLRRALPGNDVGPN